MPILLVAATFIIGILIAAVVIPINVEEKGTPPDTITQEQAQSFREIERNIEFIEPITPTPVITASPSPSPTPTNPPTPEPTPMPTPYVYVSSAPSIIYDAICGQGFTWSCEVAHNIAWCESRYDSGAYNSTVVNLEGPNNAVGLFQLLWPFHAWRFDGDPYNPYVNARAAHSLYLEKGWQPWC